MVSSRSPGVDDHQRLVSMSEASCTGAVGLEPGPPSRPSARVPHGSRKRSSVVIVRRQITDLQISFVRDGAR